MSNGANPILMVRENLAAYIAGLDEEHAKLVKRILELNEERALARTLQDVAPPVPKKSDELLPAGQARVKLKQVVPVQHTEEAV